MMKGMTKRADESPGIIIRKWNRNEKKKKNTINGETEAMSNILQTSLIKSYSSIVSNSTNTNKIMMITTIIIGNLY